MDKEIRETCKMLTRVAKSYPRGSAERRAIRAAADAYLYLRSHEGLVKSYRAYQRSSNQPLAKTQKQALKRAGVAA